MASSTLVSDDDHNTSGNQGNPHDSAIPSIDQPGRPKRPGSKGSPRFNCDHPRPMLAISAHRNRSIPGNRWKACEHALKSLGFQDPFSSPKTTELTCPFSTITPQRHKMTAYTLDEQTEWYSCKSDNNCPAHSQAMFSLEEFGAWKEGTEETPGWNGWEKGRKIAALAQWDSGIWEERNGKRKAAFMGPSADPMTSVRETLRAVASQKSVGQST